MFLSAAQYGDWFCLKRRSLISLAGGNQGSQVRMRIRLDDNAMSVPLCSTTCNHFLQSQTQLYAYASLQERNEGARGESESKGANLCMQYCSDPKVNHYGVASCGLYPAVLRWVVNPTYVVLFCFSLSQDSAQAQGVHTTTLRICQIKQVIECCHILL